jgi:hypothetical protein
MSTIAFEHWVYIDTQFVTASYESVNGVGPQIEETTTNEMGASVNVGLLGGSTTGSISKSYSVSQLKVVEQIYKHIMGYRNFADAHEYITRNTDICRIDGTLYPTVSERKRQRGKEVTYTERTLILLHVDDVHVELLPRQEHFVGGMGSLMEAKPSKPEDYALPVTSLVRMFPPLESNGEWSGIPLLIHERT